MQQESVVYAINLVIGAILAALMTQHWRRAAGRETSLAFWSVAAWVMTVADLLFAIRPALPYWVGRFFPTLLVTVGSGILLLGAERTIGQARHTRTVGAVVVLHGIALAMFLATGGASSWRTFTNGIVWAALSLVSYVILRRAPKALRSTIAIPAFVFLAHGIFHVARLSFAARFALAPDSSGTQWVQVLGDMEASFFMVALFVSLLVAHLQWRNEELAAALSDVKVLSGLLPLCAWCHKVRNDGGYWQQIEQYFASKVDVQFTHGICEDCLQTHLAGGPSEPSSGPPANG